MLIAGGHNACGGDKGLDIIQLHRQRKVVKDIHSEEAVSGTKAM